MSEHPSTNPEFNEPDLSFREKQAVTNFVEITDGIVHARHEAARQNTINEMSHSAQSSMSEAQIDEEILKFKSATLDNLAARVYMRTINQLKIEEQGIIAEEAAFHDQGQTPSELVIVKSGVVRIRDEFGTHEYGISPAGYIYQITKPKDNGPVKRHVLRDSYQNNELTGFVRYISEIAESIQRKLYND